MLEKEPQPLENSPESKIDYIHLGFYRAELIRELAKAVKFKELGLLTSKNDTTILLARQVLKDTSSSQEVSIAALLDCLQISDYWLKITEDTLPGKVRYFLDITVGTEDHFLKSTYSLKPKESAEFIADGKTLNQPVFPPLLS